MPHKHRSSKLKSSSNYNLPPSQIADPLPTTENCAPQKKSLKRKFKTTDDDTPRAFSRLFGTHRPPRSGLDDGIRPPKKGKTSAVVSALKTQSSSPSTQLGPATDAPIRQHNESLSSFAARVDTVLPLSGIRSKSGATKEFDRGRQTKTERKMQKMYKEWRKEDQRIREEAKEMTSEIENEEEETILKFGNAFAPPRMRKAKKGNRNQGVGKGRNGFDDNDPWAAIAAKRKEVEGTGGLVGLHDVVQAPPRFTKASKREEMLKLGQGGLKRLGELNEARQTVVQGYRQMMSDRRAQEGSS